MAPAGPKPRVTGGGLRDRPRRSQARQTARPGSTDARAARAAGSPGDTYDHRMKPHHPQHCRCREVDSKAAWFTPEEAAEYLRISRRSLERRMADTPSMAPKPWRKLGRSVRWKRDEIDQWVDALNQSQAGRKRRGR